MTAPTTYTVAEAAALLHKSPDWLRRELCKKKLPGRKFGRTWVLTDADLQTALDMSYSKPTVTPPDPSGLSARSRQSFNRKATQ